MTGLSPSGPGCNQAPGTEVIGFDNPRRKKYKSTVEKETKEASLTRTFLASLALGAALLALSLPANAQVGPTGSIAGRITDQKGVPVSGAYLYLTSAGSLGMGNYMTPKSGRFAFAGLVPGSYKLVAEKAGFKTVTMDGIVVTAGSTFAANFRLPASDLEDEPATARPGTALDRDSARDAVVITRDLIARLPLGRDFSAVLGLVPGLVFESDPVSARFSIDGLPDTASLIIQDDIIVSSPIDGRSMNRIGTDFIDEIVVESAAHPAESGPAQGATINIIHRAGSAKTSGSLFYSASGKGLVHSLWTDAELAEMPEAAPTALRREHDLSFTLGGPLLKDMAWVLTNIHFTSLGRTAPFNYWTDPTGVRHFVYDYAERNFSGVFKLSMDVLDKYKGVIEFGFGNLREPVYGPDIALLRPESATRNLAGDKTFLARIAGSYEVGPQMRVDLSIGYVKDRKPLLLNDMAKAKPESYDVITGYSWGSGGLNDRETASRLKLGLALTRLQDGLLGMFHELVVGGEYETTKATSSTWKADNLIFNYVDGSPYTYGRTLSPVTGEDVGWGLIGFYIAPAGETMTLPRELKRFGAFVEDRIKIGTRLSLSAGLRFDHSEAAFGAFSKGSAGNSVSVSLGSTLIDPILGYNLYSSTSLPLWDKAIVWNELSPRFGLSFDLLGGGRTVLKASWARLPEYLGLGYSQDLAQVDPTASHDFIWYDEDGNGLVNASDTYSLVPYDFRVYRTEFRHQAVDPDLSAPVIEEWTAGLEQAIGRDFTLSARYIDRHHSNLTGHVVYDPSTGAQWWRLEDAPDGWWVPFTTTVPGAEGTEDVTLNLYLPAADAPVYFERIENVPELKARYRSLEFSLHKRMSHGWQLFGSLTLNRATGTTTMASRWSAGNAPVLLTPNAFVNIAETDRLFQDRPFVARLAGTLRLGWGLFASVLFKAQSGAPWARTVTVIPPADWATSNGATAMPVTVYLESPGSHRFDWWKNVDFRLEKEFARSGRSLFGVSVDIFNLLGDTYRTLDLNDGGTWAPDGEGGSTGVRTLSGTYGMYTPFWGSRVVRLNFSLKF
jgi:hypothetical protein